MSDFTRKIKGFRFVQTQFRDTLQLVALRELGDATQWSAIAWLNKLVPPYLVDDADLVADGVLLTGATIRVPSASSQVDASVFPDEVFQTDCVLLDGALQTESGDFTTVSGRANLHQALANRIATDHGELVYHGEHGANLGRLIGALNGPVREMVAAQYVREELRKDDRIKTVNRVVAETSGDRLSISAEVTPISGANLNVVRVV